VFSYTRTKVLGKSVYRRVKVGSFTVRYVILQKYVSHLEIPGAKVWREAAL